MPTPEQIRSWQDEAATIVDPVNEYLIEEAARRISEAGKFTRVTEYLLYRAQKLGVDYDSLLREVSRRLGISKQKMLNLMERAAEDTYRYDMERLSGFYLPLKENQTIRQITEAAQNLMDENFSNITQTLGMVAPDGKEMPLREFYRHTMDYAFNNVSLGAMDHQMAIRKASAALAKKGVTSIGYESGIITSLEAAVRRNILGGLGLMVEQITEVNHNLLGADGWEISAHASSAPDHEPIQGKQFPDAEYKELNDSLKRRIGTLHCYHFAISIKMGISRPQHNEEQLKKLASDNAKGITYEGRHYTGYQATQRQRKMERKIRGLEKNLIAAEGGGDKGLILEAKGKLSIEIAKYERFSKVAGLRPRENRLYVVQNDLKK